MHAPVFDQQLLRGVAGTLSWQNVDADGEAAAPAGAVTVEVTRADGTVLAAAGSATTGSGSSPRTYALTAAQLATLDNLTAVWTDGGDASTHTTYVEVVGGFYFSVADARAEETSLKVDKYSDTRVRAKRQEVEEEFEFICGTAFVPRYRRATFDGDDTNQLLLPDRRIRRIRSVRVYSDADTYVAYTAAQLAALVIDDGRTLRRTGTDVFTAGIGNIVVEYEHGHERPTKQLKTAAMTRLRLMLNETKGGIPDRATRFTAGNDGTYELDTADKYSTGYPDIDAVLSRYSERGGTSGSAAYSRPFDFDPQRTSLFHGGRR